MRDERFWLKEKAVYPALRFVSKQVCNALFKLGELVGSPTGNTTDALRPETQVLVEDIIKGMGRVDENLANSLAELADLWEQKRNNENHQEVEDESEIFLAGLLIMHKILQMSNPGIPTITPETVRELHNRIVVLGVRRTIDEAEKMLRVDGNGSLLAVILNTFMTIKASPQPGEKHNKRSSFALGCKLMYWLWHTQAENRST